MCPVRSVTYVSGRSDFLRQPAISSDSGSGSGREGRDSTFCSSITGIRSDLRGWPGGFSLT
jgi:hypothetical protein